MSSAGQSSTSVPDHLFDLVSVLYHTLESASTNQKYIRDSQGDQELLQFFQQVAEEDNQRAEKARRLLSSKMGQA